MEYIWLIIVRIFLLFACATSNSYTHQELSGQHCQSIVWWFFFHVEVDNPRVEQPAPQAVKLVHLTVGKAAAILHGGCKNESCCGALKKGTRVCLYSPSMKPHNFAQIRCVSNVCIALYEMNFNTYYWSLWFTCLLPPIQYLQGLLHGTGEDISIDNWHR